MRSLKLRFVAFVPEKLLSKLESVRTRFAMIRFWIRKLNEFEFVNERLRFDCDSESYRCVS